MRKSAAEISDFTLKHLVREPTERSEEKPPLLLLLHGVRSNEQDLLGLAPALDGRFFVVSARVPIVLGPGAYGWYHVEFASAGPVINAGEAEAARGLLLAFIDDVTSSYSLDAQRVYLMGFSQGGAMALSVGLTAPQKVAGLVAMSGRLLPGAEEKSASPQALRELPVLVVHGTRDTVLPISYGREIRDALQQTPVDLTYSEFDMAHQVSQASLLLVRDWLQARLDTPRAAVAIS